ncbi:MAG: hypothetical protein HY907_00035, partial [Deltaproteobacteria bacterium]|nr:hypothetical protein [Deltaproteobacteria bacterium]
PVLDGVTVRHSSRDGVNGVTAFPLIRNSTFSDNAEDGIYLDTNSGLDRSASPTFSGNVLTRNGEYAMSVPADYAGEIDSTSTFTGNTFDFIRLLADTVSVSQTWQAQDVPFLGSGEILVEGASGPALTVEDGAVVRFDAGVRMIVGGWNNGSLFVDGHTAGVVFSSRASPGTPGAWQGLQLGDRCNDAATVLDGLTIEYGGANGLGNVYFYQCDGAISNSTVRYSSTWGIYRVSSSPSIAGVTYLGNTAGDLF